MARQRRGAELMRTEEQHLTDDGSGERIVVARLAAQGTGSPVAPEISKGA